MRDPLEKIVRKLCTQVAVVSSSLYGTGIRLFGQESTQNLNPVNVVDSSNELYVVQISACHSLKEYCCFLWKIAANYSFSILTIIGVTILLFAPDDYYLLFTNGISAFFEGAFGFGGSLVFLACNVEKIGWGGSVILDCILASINLSYVAFLNRTDLKVKDLKYVSVQFVVAIIGLSLGIFYFGIAKKDVHKFLPFLVFGLLACFYKVFHKMVYYFVKDESMGHKWKRSKRILALFAGFGLGSTNLEAPLSDMLLKEKMAIIPLFIAGLLVLKVVLFLLLGFHSESQVISVFLILKLVFFAFPLTKIGSIYKEEIEKVPNGNRIAELLKFSVVFFALFRLSKLAFLSLRN